MGAPSRAERGAARFFSRKQLLRAFLLPSLPSFQAMKETTNLNSELFSADAHGRQHIPFAVFAVILIHVILFLVLLVAAGCRAKARGQAAKVRVAPSEMLAGQPAPLDRLSPAASTNQAPVSIQASLEPVIATEPPLERMSSPLATKKPGQKPSISSATRQSAAAVPRKSKVYVVKAGDTVEKIAKLHRTSVEAIKAENNLKNDLLRPGQQLRVSSQIPKSSNEV
jgi:LysM repeat protein